MTSRKSRVLRQVSHGQVATCAKINLGDSRVIELCGMAGYSAVWLCLEHVPNSWPLVEHCVRAAKIHDMDTIVRVSKGSYSDYILPFECDASGIMVPHVTTASEAEAVVQSCRFHPLGRRPLDGGNVDGGFCQVPLTEYLHHSNHERFIILQIESPEALENVEEIAAVPGFDFLLFGPGDFAHRIGKPGEYTCPEVEGARRRVENAALSAGKRCMAVGLNPENTPFWERGYAIANLASDVAGLGNYLSHQLSSFQPKPEEAPGVSLYANAKSQGTDSLGRPT